ncbi:glycosyl hydrolase family 18 protein, partial [Francisella philomiragia]|uniref:glycosyl hydrolase family 18 protein n=1 Tax=Francisella philomiragia TaxID=28110 RepID=UPI0021C80D78
IDSNSTISADIPKDGTVWKVSIDAIPGFKASISPASFTANNDAQNIDVNFEQQAPIEAGKKVIGYWENWGQISATGNDNEDVAPYSHVLYSFLTLDVNPNPDSIKNAYWNGQAIYDSFSWKDVTTGYKDSNQKWLLNKINTIKPVVQEAGKKFVFALGGWSDLNYTIRPDQVDLLADKLVEVLELSGADGIDFDWEHLSQDANTGALSPKRQEQLETLANVFKTLREKLDAKGMQDKVIGYTTRFNAFFESSKAHGFPSDFNSDGEGIVIEKWLEENGSSLDKVVNWVNIMAYDVGPNDMPNNQTWTASVYEDVLSSFAEYVNPSLVVLGFEPGGQAAGGQWEGLSLDKQMIDYIFDNGFGGSMFWAMNQAPWQGNPAVTGKNAYELAKYSQEAFAEK